MVGSVELMDYLICYGRAPVQEFVTRSQNVSDAVHYIRAEQYFEIAKLTSFVTGDLTNFEKRPAFGSR